VQMSKQQAWSLAVLALGVVVWGGGRARVSQADETASPAIVSEHMDVGMEYTLTVDGKVVDSTEGKPPFHYVHGRRQIVPGLERALAGLKVGEETQVTIEPKDGYGDVDPEAFVEIARAQLPPDTAPEVGMTLRGVNPSGQGFQATVQQVKDETVVLNLNHPLAGKTLQFKIKITGIAPAPATPTGGPGPTPAS